MKFKVDQEIFKMIEPLSVGVVYCRNIDNHFSGNEIEEEFSKEKQSIKDRFAEVELAQYPVIQKWRQVYKSFGEKKKRCSVEALIRRTVNGKEIPLINPLVDIYNTASLKYELPCGGEDLAKVNNDIELTLATGQEDFLPLGEEELEHPQEGEIVYKSGNDILCGSFNYRESDITKLTNDTKECVLVIEYVNNNETDNLQEMLNYLSENVSKYLGATTSNYILTKTNNEVELKVD